MIPAGQTRSGSDALGYSTSSLLLSDGPLSTIDRERKQLMALERRKNLEL
jgi:hypothetical protein